MYTFGFDIAQEPPLHESQLRFEPPTYDHIHVKIRDPVRSPLVKRMRARSVVGSVTTSESLVLYVFVAIFFARCGATELCLWS